MNKPYYKVCKRCYKRGNTVYWTIYLELKEQFIQTRGRTSTSISTVAFTFIFIVRNFISLIINFNIIGVLLTNFIEEVVPLDLNIPFVYDLTRDNVIRNSKASRYSFNNLKWFQIIYLFDKLYEISNTNNIIIYDIGSIINISFRISGRSSINFRL